MGNGTPDPRRPFIVAHIVGLIALGLWFVLTGGTTTANATEDATASPAKPPPSPVGRPPAAPVPKIPEVPSVVDVRRAELVDGRYVQRMADGSSVTLTMDPATQKAAERALARHPIQFGSVVALEPLTGRVLAFADVVNDRGAAGPGRAATQAHHPAASVFKLVTAAALAQEAGVRPARRVCVHGGRRGLTAREIRGDRRRDRRCRRFSEGLGHSDNTMFARLSFHHLKPAQLAKTADRMGFGRTLDLPWATKPSRLDLPTQDLEQFARVSAGFWQSTLSPVHAATMTAAIADGGRMKRPVQVDSWVAADGRVIPVRGAKDLGRIANKRTAHILTRMMVETTARGTGRKAFSNRRTWPWRDGVEIASKTGSLSRTKPQFTAYSWFVAFAPADDPKIAVAALVGNPEKWYVKGIHVARETLAAFFSGERERKALASAD